MSLRSPLSKVRVLDLTRVLAGPYCSMILGDLGAHIIKVERPGAGDDTRSWQPPSKGDQSVYFMCTNRNKHSVAINIKSQQGQDLIHRLAAKSDVLIENYIPGTLSKLGLGYDQMKQRHPHLIYTSITGYGQTGPWSQKGGYDVIAAAVGGLLHITGAKEGAPSKPGVALTDLMTGLYAHGAILAALLHRQTTNQGQHIDCNLLATQISALVNIGANYLNAGEEASRWGTSHASIVPYQNRSSLHAFRTSDDRYFVIGGGNDALFNELCSLIQRPDLADDARFTSNASRVKHRKQLIDILDSEFMAKTLSEWCDVFKDSSMPNGPVNNMHEAHNNPQVLANGMIECVSHATAGQVRMAAPAVRYSGLDNRIRLAPPRLGEHTDLVLREVLHLTQHNIDLLRANNVIQ